MATDPHPLPSSPGFAMADFLVAGFILAVGLLGLTALQTATVKHGGGAWSRLTASALAANALETALAETRTGLDAPGGWEEGYDREGRPAGEGDAFFTVTVTRRAGPGAAWILRAAVTWTEGAPPVPRSLALARLAAL